MYAAGPIRRSSRSAVVISDQSAPTASQRSAIAFAYVTEPIR